ncbi:MAG: cysteine synthase A [Candidatus Lokiarchaeota archaeon]|nr:cysteine synthase A [Candidatus Lokiarchaeota archaeon]
MSNLYYTNILETIGSTPLVKLNKIAEDVKPNVFAKVEAFNPGGSVKDRVALAMIKNAEEKGQIKEDTIIIEATSGNTGIGLAMVCAVKGYTLRIVMPEDVSEERQKILSAYGAEVVLTSSAKGMEGAIKKAESFAKENDNVFLPYQFRNPSNPEIHRQTTAKEIFNDLAGRLDGFVAAVGTGGTITGVGEILKDRVGPRLKVYAVEPEASPVLSGGEPGPHKIEGMGPGFIPKVLNTEVYNEVISVSYEDAVMTTRKLARLEGILVGISSGAAAWATLNKAADDFVTQENLVVLLADTGTRYLSTDLFEK